MVARTAGGREVASSILVAPTIHIDNRGLAQLVARRVWDAEAGGSSPPTPTRS